MKKILLGMICIAGASVALAQEPSFELKDSSNLSKCSYDQQYDYENFLDAYPPKKKNNWAVGVGLGLPMLLSDIKPLMLKSYGADLKVRKAFSHVFSLRFQSIFAQIEGINYRSHDIGGVVAPLNYRTRMTDNTLQAVFTLNNINFHNHQAKVGFNLFAGAGFATSFTQFNLLDENGNPYDYSNLSNIETYSDRRFVVNEIRNLLDDGYETSDVIANGDAKIGNTRVLPSILVGAGLDFHLSKRIDLSLESRISRYLSDELDGYKLGFGEDWLVYTNIGVNFKIGKNTEPLYWQNPLNAPYNKIMKLEQGQDPATSFQDIDQDGVVDILDLDLNTPLGADVTTRGEAADDDKDGIPNYRDKQLSTPDGAKVDAFGRAIDSDGDGVADVLDMEPKTPAGSFVDVNGKAISGNNNGGGTVNNVLFMRGVDIWTIFFDSDDYTVKTDYHPIILNLASYMIENPSAELILTGYTDSRSSAEYNLELSKKRANSVLSYFTKLGIDASRFEIQYKGEQDLLVDNSSALSQQLNRRVTLRVK
ncbi:MAG: OmpA family protein [Chitinophagales bacterium]